MGGLQSIDLAVIAAYLVGVLGCGTWFARSCRSTDDFMAASRSLPGWAIGLSMFGSYVSSISFLANPGKAFAGNWNPFVFSLATPIAAAIAVWWIVPFYRRLGEVSAYEHLERRFGAWARTYAVACFLLVQMARTGTVIYLLALAVSPLTGWPVKYTIVMTGVLMTVYTMAGGMKAVVWTGVLQSIVLIAGPLICVSALLWKTNGGLPAIVNTGVTEGKFSLGGLGPSLVEDTFWIVFIYGLVINVTNFAIDQSYVQRYVTAVSDREAKKSVWITALLYVPVAALFFFIGTSLSVFYRQNPGLLGSITKPDSVLPHFIATELPAGLAGVVVAAIFAASMDSNLNSMATLTLCDIYKRYVRPNAGERESMRVLHLSTLLWGAFGIGIALAMIQAETVLDTWWQLAGIFSGGMLGLFLLGRLSPRIDNLAAGTGVVLGVLVMIRMYLVQTGIMPKTAWEAQFPVHKLLPIVFGTLTILIVGGLVSYCRRTEAVNNREGEAQEKSTLL